MDTKLLRQKILDLAIRGKLVPQDPNDEPASVLLERIKAEKERLIKEGKIKRSKQSTSTSDSRHYPFELPNGWTWCKLGEIFQHNNGKQKTSSNQGELYKYITTSNVYWQYFDLTEVKEMRFLESELDKCTATKGDLLICEGGDVGRAAIWNNDYSICFQNHLHRLRAYLPVCTQYFLYCLMFNKFIGLIKGKGIGLMSLSANELHNISIPLPPLNEQKRIVAEIERWYDLVVLIEKRKDDLHTAINQAKSKILSLAIHGKLVPQDPADEPASELLKRVNPSAEITCDNEHYPQLPNNWAICKLEDIIKYEQPTPYIVASTEYNDSYKTPVLTAGKSFIIGKTNESSGVFNNLPCIIFDDFTTDSRLVDFPFKVKSSAMKILKVSEEISIEYVTMFMSITRLIGKSHKRYWISEYSKIHIPIPPKEEQRRIVAYIKRLNGELNNLSCNL